MTDLEMAEAQIKKWDSLLYPQMYPIALVKDFIRKAYIEGLKADVHTDNSKVIAELEKENRELKSFIRDLIHENHNLCFQFNNTTCLFNSDYRNRAEELTGEKL